MTLIIAGHTLEPLKFNFERSGLAPDVFHKPECQAVPVAAKTDIDLGAGAGAGLGAGAGDEAHELKDEPTVLANTYCHGVFYAADSNITQGSTVLVNGFKKVYEIPIRVNDILMLDGWFNRYHGFIYQGSCVVAFAGSTLVSQHIMNSIRNHLGELKPTQYEGRYQLAMVCESHKHLRSYYDATFTSDDYGQNYLLDASFIANVVLHSIQSVLDKASTHNGMKKNFAAYKAEFIMSVQCPQTRRYRIFQYEIVEGEAASEATNPDTVPATAKMVEIPMGSVAVIGMRGLFEDEAKTAFTSALNNGRRTDDAMHEFLTESISSQNELQINDIGFPAFLYQQRGTHLDLAGRKDSK